MKFIMNQYFREKRLKLPTCALQRLKLHVSMVRSNNFKCITLRVLALSIDENLNLAKSKKHAIFLGYII